MFSSFGIKELLIVLLIAALIFGTKKLRNMGADLGDAVRGFRKAVRDTESDDAELKADPPSLENKADDDAASHARERQRTHTTD